MALGLLKGKTYHQLEARCEPHKAPEIHKLTGQLKLCLPKGEQNHAEFIAKLWLSDGNTRLQYIRKAGMTQAGTAPVGQGCVRKR